MKTFEQRKKEFDEFVKPKVFCGSDHCSGMWNLPCDDINHNDGRELVTKKKALEFLSQSLSDYKKELVEELSKFEKEIAADRERDKGDFWDMAYAEHHRRVKEILSLLQKDKENK